MLCLINALILTLLSLAEPAYIYRLPWKILLYLWKLEKKVNIYLSNAFHTQYTSVCTDIDIIDIHLHIFSSISQYGHMIVLLNDIMHAAQT